MLLRLPPGGSRRAASAGPSALARHLHLLPAAAPRAERRPAAADRCDVVVAGTGPRCEFALAVLSAHDDFSIAGQTDTMSGALALAGRCRPDLVLMGRPLTDGDRGYRARAITAQSRGHAAVVYLGPHAEPCGAPSRAFRLLPDALTAEDFTEWLEAIAAHQATLA